MLTSAHVERITAGASGRADGVVLRGGARVRARRAVVSNASAWDTARLGAGLGRGVGKGVLTAAGSGSGRPKAPPVPPPKRPALFPYHPLPQTHGSARLGRWRGGRRGRGAAGARRGGDGALRGGDAGLPLLHAPPRWV